MTRAMKTLALLFLVLGLISGPAYWVYAKFFTGSRLVMLNLVHSGAMMQSPDFQLEPGMAPAGLILHVSTTFPGGLDENASLINQYQVTLSRDGEAARPLAITLKASASSGPVPSFREHLLFLKEVRGGRYRVEVTPKGEPQLPVSGMQLEVRQHLLEPDSRIVTAGMLMLMLGILTLVSIGA